MVSTRSPGERTVPESVGSPRLAVQSFPGAVHWTETPTSPDGRGGPQRWSRHHLHTPYMRVFRARDPAAVRRGFLTRWDARRLHSSGPTTDDVDGGAGWRSTPCRTGRWGSMPLRSSRRFAPIRGAVARCDRGAGSPRRARSGVRHARRIELATRPTSRAFEGLTVHHARGHPRPPRPDPRPAPARAGGARGLREAPHRHEAPRAGARPATAAAAAPHASAHAGDRGRRPALPSGA